MKADRPLGRIITFYSYKGGTGRSMALANIAWILAGSGRRVLAIDWDLEAPGLHRYFRPFLIDEEVSASDGLIDLVDRYANQAIRPVEEGARPDPSWYLDYADFSDYVVSVNFDHFPAGGKIDLLPAGRQGDRYAVMVSSFNWQNFYDRLGGGGFLEAVKDKARSEYDYVLIDSRTGVSDTAGICSVQFPDTLVVCFTYNNQSIKGAAAVAHSATQMRKKLTDEKLSARKAAAGAGVAAAVTDTPLPYRIFPAAMRVDSSESDRLALRQAFARNAFAGLLGHLKPSEVPEYWSSVEVPHTGFYSYEEVLAAFKDNAHDPKTVLAAFLRLTRYLTDHEVTDYRLPIDPEQKQRFLEKFAETPLTAQARKALTESQKETEEQTLVRLADAAIASLDAEEQLLARRVLGRLVKLGRDEEGGGYFPIRANVNDFNEAEKALIVRLAAAALLSVSTEARSSSQRSAGEQSVGFADERLLRLWKTLIEWLGADRDFLIWRQQLRAYLVDWERSARDAGALLAGRLLNEAQFWSLRRADDLNALEREYLELSSAHATERARLASAVPAAMGPARSSSFTKTGVPVLLLAAVVVVVGAVAYYALRATREPPPLPPQIQEQVERQVEQQVQKQVQQQIKQQAQQQPAPDWREREREIPLDVTGTGKKVYAVPAAKPQPRQSDLQRLIEDANSPEQKVRAMAAGKLHSIYIRNPEAIDLVAEQLNPSHVIDLNVDARANHLNFLLATEIRNWREHTKAKTTAYLGELQSDTGKYRIRSATIEQIKKLQKKLNAG